MANPEFSVPTPPFPVGRRASTPLYPWPLLMIGGAALAVIMPFFIFGNASGHDFEFHVNTWMEVARQWRLGIIYPRWAEWAQFGYGEARMLFYPPASWMLGASLTLWLPWKMVPGAYVWIALTLSGCSMFLLARRWLDRNSAIVAAVLYAANPYYLVVVYWRSAYAELLAGALLPMLLLLVLRLEDEAWRAALPLSLVMAAAWLSNVPAAMIVNYSAVLLLISLAILGHKPRILLYGAVALGIGLGMAAFYLVPAVYEQRWVDISQVLSPGVRPEDNFLFTHLADADHNHFNRLMSLTATGEIVALAMATAWSVKWRARLGESWAILVTWGITASLLMLRFTLPVWKILPKLRFVQFPWRWLLVVNAALVLLACAAWRHWLPRVFVYTAMLGLLLFCRYRVQAPWWDTALDIAEMRINIDEGIGYEGTDEYVPLGADPEEIDRSARRVSLEGPGTAKIRIERWDPEMKIFSAEVNQPTRLALRLFNYPAWRADANGHQVPVDTRERTGQLVVPVTTGSNQVKIVFTRTWDRVAGGVISLLTTLAVGGLVALEGSRRHRHQHRVLIATSNAGKLRDFAAAAAAHRVTIAAVPGFSSLPLVIEDGLTFEDNARKKAEQYSRHVPGEMVLADDSGLEVDALDGAPGVHSARYAADPPHLAGTNTDDRANNARLLRELKDVPPEKRTGRFVCVIAAARDGKTQVVFRGQAEGVILERPQGRNGFGYDPLFYFPGVKQTFAELTTEQKAQYSHRGAAFRKFLEWYQPSA